MTRFAPVVRGPVLHVVLACVVLVSAVLLRRRRRRRRDRPRFPDGGRGGLDNERLGPGEPGRRRRESLAALVVDGHGCRCAVPSHASRRRGRRAEPRRSRVALEQQRQHRLAGPERHRGRVRDDPHGQRGHVPPGSDGDPGRRRADRGRNTDSGGVRRSAAHDDPDSEERERECEGPARPRFRTGRSSRVPASRRSRTTFAPSSSAPAVPRRTRRASQRGCRRSTLRRRTSARSSPGRAATTVGPSTGSSSARPT